MNENLGTQLDNSKCPVLMDDGKTCFMKGIHCPYEERLLCEEYCIMELRKMYEPKRGEQIPLR